MGRSAVQGQPAYTNGTVSVYHGESWGRWWSGCGTTWRPMAGAYPVGEEVAGYLSEKIDRYGAPLVLKRDNEGNMNHRAINDVLAESFVLPLNNPEYYAPYNGAIAESQREVTSCLRKKLMEGLLDPVDHVTA